MIGDSKSFPEAKIPGWEYIGRMIRFRPRTYILLTLSRCLVALSWLIPGLVMREFFNLLTPESTANDNVWLLLALLASGGAIQIGGVFGRFFLGTSFTRQGQTLFQRNLLEGIFRQPGASVLPETPGEAISRFREDAESVPTVALLASDLVTSGLFAFTALAILYTISARILLVAFLPLLIIMLIIRLASHRVEHYRALMRQATGSVTGFIAEAFGAAQTIQVNNAEDRLSTRFNLLNEKRRKAALKDRLFTEILDSMFRHSANLGIGVVLLMASQALHSGQLKVGDLTLFVYYLDTVTRSFTMLGLFLANYKQMGVSIKRMEYLLPGASPETLVAPKSLDPSESIARESRVGQPLVELRATNLGYHFPGSENGVDSIDLKIRPGSFTVITGPMGSGKTTLLRVLLGLLPKDSGEIFWNGEAVEDPGSFFVSPRSAYTPQIPHLISGSIRENILLDLSTAPGDAAPGAPAQDNQTQTALQNAIHLAVLENDLLALPQGLDTLIGPGGAKLSGGQIQRCAAARMFVRKPDLLVFDDLTSALDIETKLTLWKRLAELQKSPGDWHPACLMVSHRKEAFQQADHILVLDAGHAVAEGKLDDLLKCSTFIQQVWSGKLGLENK